MQKFKRIATGGLALALAGCLGIALSACGGAKEGVAATWANGEIQEEQVTNYIEYMRSLYGFSSDESGWEDFLKKRTYDSDATSDLEDLADDADKSEDAEDTAEKEDGTVADYRAYVIEQLAENDVVEWEAGQRDLEVTDEELEAEVETNRAQIESQYMAGTFESILQMQGYKDLEAYKEELKSELKVDKLKEAIVGCSESDEAWDQDKWDSFVDGLMSYADLQIVDMPSGLSYDPETIAAGDDAADADADADTEEDADATDEATAADDDATAADDEATADDEAEKSDK